MKIMKFVRRVNDGGYETAYAVTVGTILALCVIMLTLGLTGYLR